MMNQDRDAQPFLIEGTLTHLHWDLDIDTMLAKVSTYYQSHADETETGAFVGDIFNQAADATRQAMCFCEDTQSFMCLIGDQPACGQFAGAEHLPEGKNIKAVVSCENGVLYIHAAII